MHSRPANASTFAAWWRRLDKSQVLKWTVYILLTLNWAYYFFDDWRMASFTLNEGGSFLDWARAFNTTIDEFGWLGLVYMFELETYALDDRVFENRALKWSVHGFRLLCYVLLAHTVFARVDDVRELKSLGRAGDVASLCQVADGDVSFGENYEYTPITSANCAGLSKSQQLYYIEPTVITDADGHELEVWLRWIDLEDAVVWLLVTWSIELEVWLQNRDVTGGLLMLVSHSAKVFYAVLLGNAAVWAWLGHWLYAWDQFLWIAGFWAIENNIAEWRSEILDEYSGA